jgi:hypothetical protein
MNIVLLPGVQRMLAAPATGLTILLLLALGTFLSGINASLQIIFLGLAMTLAVPRDRLAQTVLALFVPDRGCGYQVRPRVVATLGGTAIFAPTPEECPAIPSSIRPSM